MNLMQECLTSLASVLGADPNDIIPEIAKVAVAEKLSWSNSFNGTSFSDSEHMLLEPLQCACRAYLAPDFRVDVSDTSIRVYPEIEGLDPSEFTDDVNDLIEALADIAIDEATRIYEDAAQFILDY